MITFCSFIILYENLGDLQLDIIIGNLCYFGLISGEYIHLSHINLSAQCLNLIQLTSLYLTKYDGVNGILIGGFKRKGIIGYA